MQDNAFSELLQLTDKGLFCPAGNFYVDPWQPVEHAVITHAHSDHSRPGSKRYLATQESEPMMRTRLGRDIDLHAVKYNEALTIGAARVSLHPAGHIRGSAQVKIQVGKKIAVVTGDYKRGSDPTTETFEPQKCDLIVTESTFGLPVFHWPDAAEVYADINAWWRGNQAAGRTSILYAYAVGKTQRVMAGLDPSIGPIYCHGAVMVGNQAYLDSGAILPAYSSVSDAEAKYGKRVPWHEAIVLAPPSAHGTPWLRRFGSISTAMTSGWMAIRGTRRRRAMDRGFVLSDHVDWPELMQTLNDCQPQMVWVTHGFSNIVARYLNEKGLPARSLKTSFVGETSEGGESGDVETP